MTGCAGSCRRAGKKRTFRSGMKACCGLRTVLAGRAEGTGAPEGLTFRSGGQEHCGLPESVIEREEDGRVGKADVPFGCAEALRFCRCSFGAFPDRKSAIIQKADRRGNGRFMRASAPFSKNPLRMRPVYGRMRAQTKEEDPKWTIAKNAIPARS